MSLQNYLKQYYDEYEWIKDTNRLYEKSFLRESFRDDVEVMDEMFEDCISIILKLQEYYRYYAKWHPDKRERIYNKDKERRTSWLYQTLEYIRPDTWVNYGFWLKKSKQNNNGAVKSVIEKWKKKWEHNHRRILI